MNIHDFKKSFYSGVIFFSTVTVLSIGYSLVGNLTIADKVGSGSGLTASSWNKIVDGILDLDTRVISIAGKFWTMTSGKWCTTLDGVKIDCTGNVPTGNTGTTGPTWPIGATGLQWIQWLIGATGLQWSTGPQWAQWPIGNSCWVTYIELSSCRNYSSIHFEACNFRTCNNCGCSDYNNGGTQIIRAAAWY